jgi:hypothetical protein
MPSKGQPCERSTVITANEKVFNKELADTIARYWKARGYDVVVEVRPTFFTQGFRGVPHEIVSDMVNGYPKGYKHGQ